MAGRDARPTTYGDFQGNDAQPVARRRAERETPGYGRR